MHVARLDHGVAHTREPVESLTDIQRRHRPTISVCSRNQAERNEARFDQIKIDASCEFFDAFTIQEIVDTQKSLRTSEHHQTHIDGLTALDVWYQPQNAIEVGDVFTHDVALDSPGSGLLHLPIPPSDAVRPLQ